MSYEGNRPALRRDLEKILPAYLAGRISLSALTRKYKVGWWALIGVIKQHTTKEQRQTAAHRTRRRVGRKRGFQKGHVPWSKGRKLGSHPGSRATQFKRGCLRGAAARNWRPVGTITIWHDKPPKSRRRGRGQPGRPRKRGPGKYHGPGRRWIKVKDTGRPQDRWVPYARWVWEKKHGPIPPRMNVVHLDGNILNDLEDNLILLSNRDRIRLHERRDPSFRAAQRAAARKLGPRTKARWGAQRAIGELKGQRSARWSCPSCGWDAGQRRRPERCPKCGGYAFEKLQVEAAS